MNLIVDVGNTSTKLAVFDGLKKVSLSRLNDLNCLELEKILSSGKIKKAIISTVKSIPPFVSDMLFHKIKFVHTLSHNSKLPFKIEYETPESLGTDRIAVVAGAFGMFKESEILIIDAGTAITFDFLSGNSYKGGNISPGISMRFKALNQFTDKLPLITPSENYSFPGRNTTDAITAGVISGVSYEINEYIRTFEKKHTRSVVLITGGDGGYIKDKLEYQVTYIPDLVIDGLNNILEYNAK
jgi:type III pantothenate kinase